MQINEKLKALRTQSGISQQNLAEYLGVEQSYISKIESSERSLTLELLNKISQLFVCSLVDLTDDNKDIKPLIVPFRKQKNYSFEDLTNISDANQIILNWHEMLNYMGE